MYNNEYLYGILQNEQTKMDLFGRILKRTSDKLQAYKISTSEITDEAFLSMGEDKYQHTLIPSNEKKDFVKGTLLEVTKEELLLTDKYEPYNYKRIKVMFESEKKRGFISRYNGLVLFFFTSR